ncbi:GAG-binding domain-containing protein, partial [Streptococcus sp. Marseille-P8640]|uniref:GAG-binding domain-containing protein n=1 Tax=Streptococcus sp. Marseille-P8640 TaxID=2866596 RepID=UPI0023B936A0
MFKSNYERKVRYSIRKFSVGVASVVVASLFLGGVVHAEVVGGGNTPTVTSSGQDKLKEYRQQLIKELEDTDLSSSRKAYYQNQIETETDAQKLVELENNFHNESRIDHEQAVEQANVSLSNYMTSLLNELDNSASGFGDILGQVKGIVREYQEKIGGASDREKIEKLQQEGQTKLDELVKKFKKGVSSSEQNGHATPKDPSQNDGVQGDDSSVGQQGEQPGASNQENLSSVPPTTPDKKENNAESGWGDIIDGSGKLLGGFSKIKEKLEKEIDESGLTSEQKKSYKEKIAKVEENDVEGLFDVHREYLNQLDFQYPELSKVEEELKYQEEQIQRMFEQKGITNGDKDAMLKKIAEIRQEAQKDIKASEGNRDKLSVAKAKLLQSLGKFFTSTKSKFEKEMQELYRKKEEEIVKEKHLEKDKIYDDADVQKLRELEKDALKKLDEAKTNDEALRVKLEFARNVEKNSQQVQKVKVNDKLQELIKEAQHELEKLNREAAEVDKLPKLPDNDPDYEIQKKYFWESQKEILDKKIEAFNKSLTEHAYTERSVKLFISDCIYYQNFAKIEAITRQVAEYRKKYPDNSEIKKIFDAEMKQTTQDNYGSLENDSLTNYFDKHFRSPFDQIKKIVEELEKKSNQEAPQKQDKVAEAQKKVEEAEKKAKVQEEEDHHNYPTNTRKTIELEIAEAQVEVAKAELELAEAEYQTPQDTDRVNTAKAKVETAKREVENLEKIKSGHGRPQAGAQKPSRTAPDTKPNHQSQPESSRPDINPAGDKRPSSEPTPTPQPEGKQPSTPKEPENKRPSLPSPSHPGATPSDSSTKPHTGSSSDSYPSASGSNSSSGNSANSSEPKVPEKSDGSTPSKPAEKEQNPSGSTAGGQSGSTNSSGSSSASTKPETPDTPKSPDVPKAPEAPQVPDTPKSPDVPKAPEAPQVPDTPK